MMRRLAVRRFSSVPSRTWHVAVVGSGPAAFYATDHLLKNNPDVHVDLFEQLPIPFGLVRFGVAPDHQDVKNVTERFEQIERESGGRFSFSGNVHVGAPDAARPEQASLCLEELQARAAWDQHQHPHPHREAAPARSRPCGRGPLLWPAHWLSLWVREWRAFAACLPSVADAAHLPPYLPTYLPACLPTYLATYLPTCLPYLPTRSTTQRWCSRTAPPPTAGSACPVSSCTYPYPYPYPYPCPYPYPYPYPYP
jgi:hypothetical protein